MARPEQVGPTVAALLGSVPGDVAILARTRATLAPIRAALEAAGVPVEWPLTHDERIAVSRVREVVRVLDKLEECDGVVLDNAAIAAMIGHGGGPWFALLERWRQDVFLSHGESGTLGGTAQRALWELLATEREERTLGEGVRLGTLHGAKGLEWRHVILVDGGDGASDDDERRLWYVGMTRAAERLDLVVRHDRPHPLLRAIGVEQVPASGDVAPTRVHYELLGLDAIWIDGLGRDAEAPGHAVLDHLEFGAEVSLEVRGPRLVLVAQGAVIAWLTDRAAGIWRDRGAVLRFVAAIRRDAEQTEPTWRAHLGRDTWWVPICEGMWREGSSSSERSSIMASPGNVQVIWAIRQAR